MKKLLLVTVLALSVTASLEVGGNIAPGDSGIAGEDHPAPSVQLYAGEDHPRPDLTDTRIKSLSV